MPLCERSEYGLVGVALRRIGRFFHPEVIVVEPAPGKRLLGREACVKSYRQFMLNSKVYRFRQSGFKEDVWDRTAVAGHNFDIRYLTKGVKYHDVGREILVLVETGQVGGWPGGPSSLIPSCAA